MVSIGRVEAILLIVLWAGCGGDSDLRLLKRADLLLRQGDLVRALETAERGWGRWRNDPDSELHWGFRLKKAEIYLSGGKVPPALELLGDEPPARFRRARATRWMHLGTARLYQARYPEAQEALRRAAELAGALDARLEAEIALRRGTAEVRQGMFDAAEREFARALSIAQSIHDTFIEASAHGNSGFLALHRSRYDEAIPHFERTVELARGIGARKIETSAYVNLGRAWLGLGDLERAEEYTVRAERGTRTIGDEHSRQICLGVLAGIYQERREPERALEIYRQALSSARKLGDSYAVCLWLNELAAVLLANGDLDGARKLNQEALEVSAKLASADSRVSAMLVSGRIAQAEGRDGDAESIYRRVAASTVENALHRRWEAEALLAALQAAHGNSSEADAGFRRALASVEHERSRLQREVWQLSFQSASRRFYDDYIEFLMGQGRAADALAVAESSRARVLAGKLGIAGGRAEGDLRIANPAAFSRLARETGAALVSYWLAPKRSFVWVVTAAGLRVSELPPDAELRELVDAYSAAIASGRDPIATSNPAGAQLARTLVEPLGIPRGSRVIVSPDGFLNALNLESIPVQEPRPHYWIEDVTVVVVPSLALGRERAAGAAKPSLLVLGDPRPPAGEFAALPAAAEEVARIRKRLERYEQAIYTGAEAQPPAYAKAAPGRFSVIHFAAHSTANTRDPLDSAVILSPSAEGYRLYARDILKLPLRARIVTLSSCRGAGSRLYRGEGLVGFAWAFLHAGASNVVAGLWDVNDASTGALMDGFYGAIAAGDSAPDALRKAKLFLARSEGAWRKPYYWAPFELFSAHPQFSVKRSRRELY